MTGEERPGLGVICWLLSEGIYLHALKIKYDLISKLLYNGMPKIEQSHFSSYYVLKVRVLISCPPLIMMYVHIFSL